MLVELRLENYAVIDNLVVEFASGLNLLTGETGAGKSILIDALTLLLGEKASTDVIRSGAERAVNSAVFEIEAAAAKTVAKILEENGLDSESDSVILRREIASGGEGKVSSITSRPRSLSSNYLALIFDCPRAKRNPRGLRWPRAPELARCLLRMPTLRRSRSISCVESHSNPHRGTPT